MTALLEQASLAVRTLELMRDTARTRRCHTQRVIHSQSVGEHTFGALAILDVIAPDCRKEVWRALLYHDAPEAITGDVPAPAKWENADLERALRRIEQNILVEHGLMTELTEEETGLLKFADIMELILYGLEEMAMGNRGVVRMVNAAFDALRVRGLLYVTEQAVTLLRSAHTTFSTLEKRYDAT